MAGITRRQLQLLLRQTIEEDDLENFLGNVGNAYEQAVRGQFTAQRADEILRGMRRGLGRIQETILGDHYPGQPQIDFTDARTQAVLDTLTNYLGFAVEGHRVMEGRRQGEEGLADFLALGLDQVNPLLREIAGGGAGIAGMLGLNWANLQRIANGGGLIGGAVGGILGSLRGVGHRVSRMSPLNQALLISYGASALSSSMDYLYNKAINYAFGEEDKGKVKDAQAELKPLYDLLRKQKGTENDVAKLTLLDRSGAQVSAEQIIPHYVKTVAFFMEQLRKQHNNNKYQYDVRAQLTAMNDGTNQYNSVVI